MWVNDRPGKRASKKRSSRMPASSPLTVTVCTPLPVLAAASLMVALPGLTPAGGRAAGTSSSERIRRNCGKRNSQSAVTRNTPAPPSATAGSRAEQRRHRAGAEIAEIVRGAGEHAVDRADPAAHLGRRAKLHQRKADHHADRVGRAQHRQRRERQEQVARQREHDGGAARTREITPNSTLPIGMVSGRRASSSDIASAPTAGAARSRPRPHGPVWRMSRAKIGNSAPAPARNTAHMSSAMVPRMTRSLQHEAEAAHQRAQAQRLGRRAARRSMRIMAMKAAPMHHSPMASAIDRGRTQPVEQPAEHRADDLAGLVGGGEPGGRRRHQRPRHQRRDDRHHGRDLEGARGADQRGDDVDRQRIEPAHRGAEREHAGGDRLAELAGQQDGAVVVAVGDVADQQRQHQHRHELREPEQAEIERAAGQRIELPADRHHQHLERQDRDDPADPVEGEGAMAEHRRRGGGGHTACAHLHRRMSSELAPGSR